MSRISFSTVGETEFQKLLGHNPEIMEQWNYLGDILSREGQLSSDLKEQVRRKLAFGNKCEYCMAKGKPSEKQMDEKTNMAVTFADIFLNHRSSIDDNTFDVLKETFNEQEIIELCSFICFTTASQQFGAMMNLKPAKQ